MTYPQPDLKTAKQLIDLVLHALGPQTIVLHVISTHEDHEDGCECMECAKGHEYTEETDSSGAPLVREYKES